MKTLLKTLICFLFCLPLTLTAQINLDVEGSGVISENLEVMNNTSIGSGNAGIPLRVSSSSNNLAARFDYSSGAAGFEFFVNPADGFNICESGIACDRFFIAKGSGNVGIGTSNPMAKLDVTSDALINGLTIGRGGGSLGRNSVIGIRALLSNTTGDANSAFGYEALFNNSTGVANTANGAQALSNNTTGSENTATGHFALLSNQTGGDNTGDGNFALFNTTGSDNTAVGSYAGQTNTTGDYNTFIGAHADATSGGLTNATAIGANAEVTTSNSMILGNNVDIGIGHSTPTSRLDVHDSIPSIPETTYEFARFNFNADDMKNNLGAYLSLQGKDGNNGGAEFGRIQWQNVSDGNEQSGKISIWTADDSGIITEAVTVDESQNVGIGTNSPDSRLDVDGQTTTTSAVITNLQMDSDQDSVLVVDGNGLIGYKTVEPKTRSFIIKPGEINDMYFSGGAMHSTIGSWAQPSIEMPDAVTSDLKLSIPIPTDWDSTSITLKVLYTSTTNSGDINCSAFHRGFEVGQTLNTGIGGGPITLSSPANAEDLEEGEVGLMLISPASRILNFQYRRRGADPLDTSTGTLHILGFVVEYTEL